MESGEKQVNESVENRMSMDPDFLKAHASEAPGIYIFKDGSGRPIYVGKAKNLKKRVLSYFRASRDLPHKTQVMMSRAKSLEFILTSTDKEAFILEKIDRIRRQIGQMTVVCSGTLLQRTKVCGKPTCRCAVDPDARHGPYYEWNRLREGKLVHCALTPEQARMIRLAISNRRKILRLLRVWEQKSVQLMNVQIER